MNYDSPISRKLGTYVALSEPDLTVLAHLLKKQRTFDAGHDMVHEGQSNQSAFILAKGWVCSYKLMPDGGRQVIDFQIPGDFLGLRSVLFRTADHSIEPVTKAEASEVAIADLLAVFSGNPRLATAMLWAVSRDEAMVVEHLVGLGRRNALERTAHFLLELGARLKLVGLSDSDGYQCPLSQFMLADALGLTAVHLNRVLRKLREEGLLSFRNKKIRYLDYDRLVALAGFDKAYLDHEGPLLS